MVSDAGLKKLTGLKKLKTLQISQTPATDAGVEELKATIPGLKVVR